MGSPYAEIHSRLERLEAESSIRKCIRRYMDLCDTLGPDTPLDELAGLFTEGARWIGEGARFKKAFGEYSGRIKIAEMFRGYMTNPPHFQMNVHFLCSESIEVATDSKSALTQWVMFQTSTLKTGTSRMSAARLTIEMKREVDHWRISKFQTRNLFSRDCAPWDSDDEHPTPA